MADGASREAEERGVAGELGHDRHVGDRDLTTWSTPVGREAADTVTRASSRVGADRALIVILVVGIAVVTLLAFLAARVYDAVTERDGVAGLDGPVLRAAIDLRSRVLDGLAAVIAEVFGPVGMPIIALAGCVVLAVRRHSRTPVILTVAAGVGSLLMTIAGKDIIDRHRPPLVDAIPPYEHSPSFPSGHTLNAVVICGILAYLLILRRRRAITRMTIAVAAGVVAVAVGLSRVLLGAHWFTDVLAGWLLGAGWLVFVITAHRLYLTARRRHASAVTAPRFRPRPPAASPRGASGSDR